MKSWKPFNDQCPRCGNDAEVYTSAKGEYVYDGDNVECFECGLSGSITVNDGNDDGIDPAYVVWNDFED